MTRSINLFWPLLLVALGTSAAHANSKEHQAWSVESKGFLEPHSAEIILQVDGKTFFASPKDMEALGFDLLKLPTENGLIDLSAAGALRIDDLNQKITVEVHPKFLPATNFNLRSSVSSMQPEHVITASLLNYDIRASDDTRSNLSGMLDFSKYLSENVRANLQTMTHTGQAGAQRRFERISASLIGDYPDRTATWVIGDAYSSGGRDVNPVSFTGMQIKKNFLLQPDFIPNASHDIKGTAATPSAMDVYINNQKVISSQIPAGPFSLTNMTGLDGTSEARIVVRDEFGHEKIITTQLLGGPEFLKKGLSSYAVQAGSLRPALDQLEGYFASGYYQHGISDFLTAEVNAEKFSGGATLPDVKHAGLSLALSTPVGNFGWSHRAGSGHLSTTSFHSTLHQENWSLQLHANQTSASRDYRIMGSPVLGNLSRRTLQASVATNSGISASLIDISGGDTARTDFSLNYRQMKAYAINYTLTISHNRRDTGEPLGILLGMNIPLERTSSSRHSYFNLNAGRDSSGIAAQNIDYYDAPTDLFGTTYRLQQAGYAGNQIYDTEVTHRAPSLETGVAASRAGGRTAYRTFLRGSVIEHEGKLGFSRWIENGYAVIDAGQPDIRVKVNGQYQASTDMHGLAYAPIQMAYTQTDISLDPETVPANYDNNAEKRAIPFAGGAYVAFRGTAGAMVKLPTVHEGYVTVNGQIYPITDRGFFVELPAGSYTGKTNNQQSVRFTVPSNNDAGTIHIQGEID